METQIQGELEQFQESMLESAPVSIFLNTYKPVELEWNTEPMPWNSQGRYLTMRPVFTLDPAHHAGAYYVQEASSMFLGFVLKQLEICPNTLVLDLCAAPGGKTFQLQSVLGFDATIVSNEVIRGRVNILRENITRWGAGNMVVSNNDPSAFQSLNGLFDLVLVDAPCSGEGLFRKDITAREKWSMDSVIHCASRQRRILADSIGLVKENGYLIYSTCTYSPEENEENLRWICENSEFQSLQIQLDSSWGVEEKVHRFQGKPAYTYHFLPHRLRGEGFFIAVLKCIKPDPDRKRGAVFKKSPYAELGKKLIPCVSSWLEHPEAFNFLVRNDKVYAFPAVSLPVVKALFYHLNIVTAGIPMGKIIQGVLIPDHALALSIHLANSVDRLEVDRPSALRFLKKMDFPIDKNHRKGWTLITFKGLALGWVKILDKRINNYYPKSLMIRMELPEL